MTGRPELEGVAIVGLACRFPGATTAEAYWELLRSGREAIRRFSADELRAAGVRREVLDDPLYVPARGMLENVDQFDAGFFHLSPRDADLLDPQQRLWLECAWEALEDAGYHGATCGKSVGVFAGSRLSSYLLHNLCGGRQQTQRIAAAGDPEAYQILLGNDKDLLPTRTSYLLDLHGPSLAVQTACSSSLVAVAQACQSLLTWQCDLSLAGGACVVVPSVQGYRYQPGGIASPDGHCRAFDARAQGTVFGDGVGVVLLKRLGEAVADGDAIYAVIRGFAVNNDGTGKVSIAAPSVDGQAEVVALAQAMGGVDPRSVTYVEAHGTGTALGDPVEVAALTKAFRLGTEATGFCGLGSVKTNIGHADAAAGIAGLIKAALALQHGQIPPTLHFETPNPAIDLERSPFFVVRELTPWPSDGRPRRAGVSSLGVGGTNCHVVLEEAPRPAVLSVATERPRHLLALSARSEPELRSLASRYADHLASRPDDALADVCFTANTGRAMFRQRLAATAGTSSELSERLAAFAAAGSASGATEPGAPPPAVAFLFTGQGAIYAGMGRDLYDTQPVFRTALDRCDAALRSSLDRSLIDLLYRAPDGDRMLERADYAQPALVAVEVALAELWRSWGIVPDRVLGHSIGELAAACVAGVFTLEDGLRLVAERARLIHALPEPGVMVAALASEEQVTRALASSGGAAIAGLNAPGQVVLSGEKGAVEAATAKLRAMGVETRPLRVSHAFHSPVMDPVLDPFERAAAAVPLAQPRIELISSVSGAPAGADIASAAYWRGQIRHPVRFADAFAALESRGPTLLIEIGPHPVLLGLAELCSSGASRALLPSLDRNRPGWATILESLGRLYEHGRSVDWRGFDAPYQRRRLHLPTYPFRRRRHWVEPSDAPEEPAGDAAVVNPLLGRRLSLPLSSEIRFEIRLSARAVPLLNDHRLFGTMVLAASSQFALFLSAVEAAFGPRACVLEDTTFRRPLLIPDEGAPVVQVMLAPLPNEAAAYQVQLVSRPDSSDPLSAGAWTLHATSHLRLHDVPPWAPGNPAALRPAGASELTGETFYEERWAPGAGTGPAFRRIEAIWRCDPEAMARVTIPDSPECAAGYPLHPGVIEACFQTLFHAGTFETRALAEQGVLYVPFTVERFAFQGRSAARRWWCHGRARESYPADAPAKRGDMRLLDDENHLVAEITGFEVRRLRREVVQGDGGRPDDLLHQVVWEPRDLEAAGTSLEGDWLVLASGDGDGARLAAALEARGARGTVLDTAHPDALRHGTARGIVYLAGLDQAAAESECANLLHLAQALASHPVPPRLWLVTRHTQAVVPDDALPGARLAALWGMGRVIARELPRVGLTCVDLDGNAGNLAGLLDEFEAGSESEVALRQGRRYVPRLLRYRPSLVEVGAEPFFREHATYLVTDGVSSQGQLVAEWLVRHGARHLILSSSEGSSPASYQEAQVVQVRSDPQRPEVTVARLRDAWATMPPLAGIFHLDLAMDDGVVPRQTRERLRTALAGAALGWALHEETRSLGLHCFVCFSTSAALLGTPGQSTYAAAGAAVDALVQHRRRQGLAGLSVNWGPWAEAGKAAALSPVLRQRLRDEGWMPLATATALEVLKDLLRADVAQAAVLPIDWGRYLTAQSPGGSAAFLERVAGERDEKPPPGAPRPITDSEDGVVEHLRRLTAEVLGVAREEIGEAESLLELGFDSLGALRLENRIRADLGTHVPMGTILRAPNLRGIATAVAARRQGKA
jgi:acyl transferase domain-containing protein/acyl carrier protein